MPIFDRSASQTRPAPMPTSCEAFLARRSPDPRPSSRHHVIIAGGNGAQAQRAP